MIGNRFFDSVILKRLETEAKKVGILIVIMIKVRYNEHNEYYFKVN
mgnify:CR=1 FL=1